MRRARALGQVICDVSGPIGCHLSSRCRRVPPPSPCYLVTLSLFPSLSLPSSSSLPLALPPTISVATPPPPRRCNSRMQSDPRRSCPSRFHPRAKSPLGLTYAIALLLLFLLLLCLLRSNFPPRPFPRRDFLPSSAPTIARFLLLIVPASILNPLSFHLFSAAMPMA